MRYPNRPAGSRPSPTRCPSKRGTSSVLLAAAVGSLVLAGCSSDDDDDDAGEMGGEVEAPTESGAPTGSFAIVMNDGAAPGSVVFYSPDLETLDKTLSTGYNQGVTFGDDGTLYQNGDMEGATGLVAFPDAANRPDMDGFGVDDSTLGDSAGKGLEFIAGSGLLASCDVTDEAADLKFFDAETGELAASVDLAAPCWDSFYVAEDDRLYVAGTDGVLAVLDGFVAELDGTVEGDMEGDAESVGPAVDRMITPVDEAGAKVSVNLHGVHVEDGTVLLSDVGSADSATDGQLFVFDDDGSVDGDVTVSPVGGPATLLGNPVDALLRDGSAIVAEKSNDAILVFEDIAGATGDVMPTYMLSFTKPESITEVPGD